MLISWIINCNVIVKLFSFIRYIKNWCKLHDCILFVIEIWVLNDQLIIKELISGFISILKCSLSEVNYDYTHIITPFTFCSCHIWRYQSIQHTLSNLVQLDLSLHLYVNIINDLLTGLCFPYTVTSNDNKISFISYCMYFDIREWCYCLFL